MLEFFRKLFRPTPKKAIRRRPVRLVLEAYEPRELMSASPLCAGMPVPSMSDHSQSISTPAGSSDSSHQCQDNSQNQTLTATLAGATGTSGSAAFKSNTTSGDNSLQVLVSGLVASSTFTVMSGTTTLGTITTDSSGSGTLSVSDLSPALASGAVITVVDANQNTVLTGTLADASQGTTVLQGTSSTQSASHGGKHHH
jgi:hypothetical protein